MEEILASIRRIIADDQPPGAPVPHEAPAASSRASLPAPEATPLGSHAAEVPLSDLPMASETAQAAEPDAAMATLPPEHGTVAAPQFVSPEGTAGFADTPHPLAPHPSATAQPAEPVPETTQVAVSEPDAHEAALQAMHDELDVRAAIYEMQEDTLYEAVAEKAPMRDQPMREPPTPPLDKPEPASSAGLFSAATSQSLASAFNTLAISRLAADSHELRGLAQEMLRPLLKDWLNEHLPSLVEAIIRDEIDQMARRPR